MGLNLQAVKFLIEARQTFHTDFEKTLTLGRQRLRLNAADAARLARDYALDSHALTDALMPDGYSEKFIENILGAQEIISLDNAAYEDCSFVHDLNRPILETLHQRFDAVIDGGTLEHVFNFPVALANSMKMVKQGGRLFLFTPANNQMGHGFYQFSPELFYSALSAQNGFSLERMVLYTHPFVGGELGGYSRWYNVANPQQTGKRVRLMSSLAAILMIQAQRIAVVEPFQQPVMQSDYVELWEQTPKKSASAFKEMLKKLLNRLPRSCHHLLRGIRQRAAASLRNRTFFQPVHPKKKN